MTKPGKPSPLESPVKPEEEVGKGEDVGREARRIVEGLEAYWREGWPRLLAALEEELRRFVRALYTSGEDGAP